MLKKISGNCFIYAALISVFCSINVSAQTKTIDRPAFTMEYPSDWKVAEHQPDYDPDKLFTIDTSGQSTVTIEVLKLSEKDTPDELLFHALYILDGPLVDTYSRSGFDRWGKHDGEGKHLKGKVMGMFPGGARIFFMKQGDIGLMITEVYYSEDLDTAMAGFELIGNTFTFK